MKSFFHLRLITFVLVSNSLSVSANSFTDGNTRSPDDQRLLYNREFADFVYQAGKNSVDFYNELKNNNCWNKAFVNNLIACKTKDDVQKLCQRANVSYDVILNASVYPNSYYVGFLYRNPGYFEMDGIQQSKEYASIISKICLDPAYRDLNIGSPLVQALLNLMSYTKTKCGTVNGRMFNLTWDELSGCLVDGIGAFVATNLGPIRTAWSLLTGNFALWNVIRVLQLAFPEFSAAAALVTTAACIVKEWIW